MKDNKVYLKHILDCIEKIEVWVEGNSFEDFADDNELLQSSVIRQLEVIGEAANKVGPNIQTLAPKIPWKNIIGMRNRLIHEYMSIDLTLTWGVIKYELPALKKEIKTLLNNL